MRSVPVAFVDRNCHTSHLFAVVVWVGVVPPAHVTPDHVIAPAEPPEGLHTITLMFAPAVLLVWLIDVAEVPILRSCVFPAFQSIVIVVEVARVFSTTLIEPVATSSEVAGDAVLIPSRKFEASQNRLEFACVICPLPFENRIDPFVNPSRSEEMVVVARVEVALTASVE